METMSERLKERCTLQYREADRTVKRIIRADKPAYMENLASQAEEAASRGKQGKVYKITKLDSGQLTRNNGLANCGQAKATSYHRSRTRSQMSRTLQRSSKQATTSNGSRRARF